jgi:predicted phosphodiesterase
MAAKPLSDFDCEQTMLALVKAQGNHLKAAREIGMNSRTFTSRVNAAVVRGFNIENGKVVRSQTAGGDLEMSMLRDKVRQLELQLKTAHRETLSDEFVKRKIFKLTEKEVTPPEWLTRPPKGSHITGVPTLLASDWHFAEVVEPSQVNGVNEYNIAIARDRARIMIEVTIDLLKNHIKHKNYPGIVFAIAGDMVSGNIHEELSATNEVEIMPCVIELWGTLSWCISTLADEFGNVFVPCVTGNHGRDTKKMRMKGRNFTSFDWLCYQFLAKRFENDKRIQFLIPDGSDAHWNVYGHRYCMTHGDQFRGGDSMIGALGPITRGDHKKRGRDSQIGMDYDVLLMGHWHQLIQLQRLIVNGSLKGYDEYAYQSNFGFEPARQALWITHPQHGITFSAPVLVQRDQAKQSGAWVSWKA